MSNESFVYGGYYHCVECDKVFYICNPTIWAYKRYATRKESGVGSKLLYFCSYHCKRSFDKRYDEKPKKKREGKKGGNKLGKICIDRPNVLCGECRYCMSGRYGFKDCTLYGRPVDAMKQACLRYKPIVDKPLDKNSLRQKEYDLYRRKVKRGENNG